MVQTIQGRLWYFETSMPVRSQWKTVAWTTCPCTEQEINYRSLTSGPTSCIILYQSPMSVPHSQILS